VSSPARAERVEAFHDDIVVLPLKHEQGPMDLTELAAFHGDIVVAPVKLR
jgi:hypothetical protein